jgi:hypothetical protein
VRACSRVLRNRGARVDSVAKFTAVSAMDLQEGITGPTDGYEWQRLCEVRRWFNSCTDDISDHEGIEVDFVTACNVSCI